MRPTCPRCRRPARTCYCDGLHPVPTRTRVVFLQHPRERRVPIGTARLAHLALANSELHVGVHFAESPRVARLVEERSGDVALLFPSDAPAEAGPVPVSPARPPSTLVVIDGTWPQARKLLKENPSLLGLPRLGLRPGRPSNYRIRREPAAHCLSTVEAVAEVLGHLEGEPARFQPMLRAFERMVDFQLDGRATRVGPPRTRSRKVRPARQWAPPELLRQLDRLVLVYGEANAPAFHAVERFAPELIHLGAVRPSTGQRFEAVLAPRQALSAPIPRYVELPVQRLLDGETVASALERWAAFAGEGAVLGVWGTFVLDLLRSAGDPPRTSIDLRQASARWLGCRKPGGVENAAATLAAPAPTASGAAGRCGRRLGALERVLQGLVNAP